MASELFINHPLYSDIILHVNDDTYYLVSEIVEKYTDFFSTQCTPNTISVKQINDSTKFVQKKSCQN